MTKSEEKNKMQVLKKQRAANEEVPPQKKRSDKQPMYVLSAVDNDIKGWVIFQALQRTNITKKEKCYYLLHKMYAFQTSVTITFLYCS